ncbi:MAG: hypothetical protein H6740_26150 [Alphaproteobacteria bacterium]|nr:hypothetical protein [Alphaproteobacteria bacterium]
MLLLAAVLLSGVGLIEAGAGGPDPRAALLRVPLTLRELLPALLALAALLHLTRLRERRALLALGCAGVGRGLVQGAAALGLGALGLGLGLALEWVTPHARDAAAEAEAAAQGQPLSVSARWAATNAGLVRVGAPAAQGPATLTLLEIEGGTLRARLDARGPRWTRGAGWTFEEAHAIGFTEDGPAEMEVSAAALPGPATLERLTRRAAPVEASLFELPASERRWRWHRAAGLVAPGVASFAAVALALGFSWGPALAVAGGAALLATWQLLALALADTALAGWAPLLLLLLVSAAAQLRPVRWTPASSGPSAEG